MILRAINRIAGLLFVGLLLVSCAEAQPEVPTNNPTPILTPTKTPRPTATPFPPFPTRLPSATPLPPYLYHLFTGPVIADLQDMGYICESVERIGEVYFHRCRISQAPLEFGVTISTRYPGNAGIDKISAGASYRLGEDEQALPLIIPLILEIAALPLERDHQEAAVAWVEGILTNPNVVEFWHEATFGKIIYSLEKSQAWGHVRLGIGGNPDDYCSPSALWPSC